MNRSETIIVRWEPARGMPFRVRLEPRDDGRWRRVTEEWNGCLWRLTGHAVVNNVAVTLCAADTDCVGDRHE